MKTLIGVSEKSLHSQAPILPTGSPLETFQAFPSKKDALAS